MERQRDNTKHPVWDVYDEYRTARLNVKLINKRLVNLKRFNFIIEVLLAITAASSGLASVIVSLWFFKIPIGAYIWKILCGLTAVIAVIKPFLKLPERIQNESELFTEIKSLHHDFSTLIILINQRKKYDDDLKTQFVKLLDKKGNIEKKSTEGYAKKRLKIRYEQEVMQELPIDKFFIPEE